MLGRKGCWTLAQKVLELDAEKITLYVHNLKITTRALSSPSNDIVIFLNVINNDANTFTKESLIEYLQTDSNYYLSATGYDTVNDYTVCAIKCQKIGTSLYTYCVSPDGLAHGVEISTINSERIETIKLRG